MRENVKRHIGVAFFYVVFFGFIILEDAVVRAILFFSRKTLHAQWIGPYLAGIVFAIGGVALALIQLHFTSANQSVRDPILKFSCWLFRKFGYAGFIVNSLLLGPPSALFALKRENYEYKLSHSFISAMIFALVWVPLFLATN